MPLFALVLASAAALPGAGGDGLFDLATGYRIAHYRAPIAAPPPGVRRIDTDGVARAIARGRAIPIDVLPAEGAVCDATTGAWRLARPGESLPGAHWLPGAGAGVLDPATARWFTDHVAAARAARPRARVIVYCLADCWHSWNAALRLQRAGIRPIFWYGEGVDGWKQSGRTLMPVSPRPHPHPAKGAH